jgi:hypothetical protein
MNNVIYKDFDSHLNKFEDSNSIDNSEVDFFAQHINEKFFTHLPSHVNESKFLFRNYTVAVTGGWGSGKTSLVRMALDQLQYNKLSEKHSDASLGFVYNVEDKNKTNGNIIWLEPWYFKENNSILKYFLESIKLKLIDDKFLDKDDISIDNYINKLIPNKKVTSILFFSNLIKKVPLLSKLQMITSLFVVFSVFIKLDYLKFINGEICSLMFLIIILGIGIYSVYYFIEKLKKIINVYEKDNPADLEGLKQKISEVLEQQNSPLEKLKRYVIVIDDIDRLTDEQIISVMTSVKQVIDFPNLMFILLYDEKHVNTALTNVFGYNGKLSYNFMDKIVNYKKTKRLSVVYGNLEQAVNTFYYQAKGIPQNQLETFSRAFQSICQEGVLNIRDQKRICLEYSEIIKEKRKNGILEEYDPVKLLASVILK